jgi:hypothetical protein
MILNSLKKVDGVWNLVIVQSNNGKISLIVTDYRQPDQKVTIKPIEGSEDTFALAMDSVQNKKLRLYISNHRKHLYYLVETYKLSKILRDADHPESYVHFINKRIDHCEEQLEKNITKSKKKYIQ